MLSDNQILMRTMPDERLQLRDTNTASIVLLALHPAQNYEAILP